MRALFYNIKGAGHVNPTLPLARGLVAAGHEVHYTLTMEWKERILALGATFLNTGEGDSPFTTGNYHPDAFFPLQLVPTAAAILPRLLDDARRLAPDVIVYDTFAPWGRAVADVLGVPAVSSVSTLVFSAADAGASVGGVVLDEKNREASRTLKEQLGVDLRSEDIGRFFAADNLVYSAPVLNPASADHPGRFHFVGPLLPAADPDALAAGGLGHLAEHTDRRRIYVSMGTVLGDMMRLGPEFFAPFIAAFGGDPRYDLVLSIGKGLSPDAFGEVPSNVTLRPFVPQTALLPHVDVFVTHAGANSMHEALFHGVPTVCIPGFGDQPGNARRIADLGAGVTVPMKEVEAGKVRSAVEQILGDASFRDSAARIAAELQRTGGVAEAVAVVERAAAGDGVGG